MRQPTVARQSCLNALRLFVSVERRTSDTFLKKIFTRFCLLCLFFFFLFFPLPLLFLNPLALFGDREQECQRLLGR